MNNPNSNSNSGLLRFRSAPSSLFPNSQANSYEKSGVNDYQRPTQFDSQSGLFEDRFEETKPNLNGYSSNSPLPPHYPKHNSSSLEVMSSTLARQSSSPAGLFSHINVPQNGYGALRRNSNYISGNGTTSGDMSPSSSGLRSPSSSGFSSGLQSSLGILSQISEIEEENGNCDDHAKLGSRYMFGSWNDSNHFPDSYSVFKRDLEDEGKLFSSSQDGASDNRMNLLSRHLSLPKTTVEMADTEKFLQFHGTVPCKVRAKRGFATHPRSIAERVRRTRISERMKKLQEFVPNMDKQTNTAEMLDLAVEYIKDLQKQCKILSENRAKCRCSSMQKAIKNL